MAEKSGELTNGETELETSEDIEAGEEILNPPAEEISDDPDELRGQIEETRRGMGETLEAIQEKLSISNITEQVKEQVTEQINGAVETLKTTVSDATIGKAGKFMKNIGQELKKSNFAKTASENPLPLILIGLGLGLLAFGGSRLKTSDKYAKYRYRNNDLEGETSSEKPNKLTEKAGKIYQSAGDSVGSAYQSVSETAGSTYRTVSDAASGAYDKVGDFGGQLRGQYESKLEENPLVVGAVALAIGAAVGLAIPSTRYEGQLMGEARENLLSKAETAARGALEKVQEVVGQTKDTLIEDVQQVAGLAKETIAKDVQQAVDQAKEAFAGEGKEAVKN